MPRLIIDYLEKSVKKTPNKIVFYENRDTITYCGLRKNVYKIATQLVIHRYKKQPIAIFLDKSIACIEAFLGIAYSGNFYTLIDTEMPETRISKILEILNPIACITDKNHYKEVVKVAGESKVFFIEQILESEADEKLVQETVKTILSIDICYVMFTSGSTGIPKGVVTPHRAVTEYIEALSMAYGFEEDTVIGNQVPFYFVMSIVDIYATIYCNGSMHIIPKALFTFPGELVKYISTSQINTLSWVPSALCSISQLNAFKAGNMDCLRTIIFGGETMPIKQLKKWMKELPDATYINGYGPTEITDGCTYYIVNREFSDNESLPIGRPFPNSEIIVLDDNNELIENGEIGELCVRSSSMTYGYYNEREKTDIVFIQNPLNTKYNEKIYKTGDLVRYNKYGELEYVGRKDLQIKHMGRRIELGEIETNVSSIEGVFENCCVYEAETKKIILYYTGRLDEEQLREKLSDLLPVYMMPNKRIRLTSMPHNVNGKIDRAKIGGKDEYRKTGC